jgi:hypothetical protein
MPELFRFCPSNTGLVLLGEALAAVAHRALLEMSGTSPESEGCADICGDWSQGLEKTGGAGPPLTSPEKVTGSRPSDLTSTTDGEQPICRLPYCRRLPFTVA